MPNPSGPVSPHHRAGREDDAESQQILQTTRELCQQLKITNYNPSRVDWLKWRPGGGVRVVPDQPLLLKNRIILTDGLQGRLAPEKWKAILAASFARKLNRKWVQLGAVAILASITAILIVAGYLLPIAFPQPVKVYYRGGGTGTSTLGAEVVLIAGPLGLIIWMLVQTRWWSRRMMRISDQQAATFVGKDVLLDALRLVKEFVRSEATPVHPRRFRRQLFRLEERIARVEAWSPSTGSPPK